LIRESYFFFKKAIKQQNSLCLLPKSVFINTQITIQMKKLSLLVLTTLFLSCVGFAQTQKAVWPELKAFHAVMSGTFHPAEEGNFAPLKEKAAELYRASKVWVASEIPANYKPEETKATLEKLMLQCHDIWAQVDAKATDEKLKTMITEAHDTFHKIVGECKKD
jgi:hypothetical protein